MLHHVFIFTGFLWSYWRLAKSHYKSCCFTTDWSPVNTPVNGGMSVRTQKLLLCALVLLGIIYFCTNRRGNDKDVSLKQLLAAAIRAAEIGGLQVVTVHDQTKFKIESKGQTKEGNHWYVTWYIIVYDDTLDNSLCNVAISWIMFLYCTICFLNSKDFDIKQWCIMIFLLYLP